MYILQTLPFLFWPLLRCIEFEQLQENQKQWKKDLFHLLPAKQVGHFKSPTYNPGLNTQSDGVRKMMRVGTVFSACFQRNRITSGGRAR